MSKLRAGSTIPFVLPGYRDDKDATRYPLCVLSADSADRLMDLRNDYIATPDTDKAKRRFLRAEMLKLSVSGIEPSELTATLTDRECFELIAEAIRFSSLTVDERKKFALQCLSETASSADDAGASVLKE